MGRFQVSTSIARPIADVFEVLTDVERTGAWFPGDVEEHWTTPPPHGVGAMRHAVVTVRGRRTENDAITTAFEPPRYAAMRGISPNAPFEASLTFAETAVGTNVEVAIDIALKGPARVIGPLFTTWYRGQWRTGLATLKRMMESGEL